MGPGPIGYWDNQARIAINSLIDNQEELEKRIEGFEHLGDIEVETLIKSLRKQS